MKNYTFEINSASAFLSLGKYLQRNKIEKGSIIKIKVLADSPSDFNIKVASITGHTFCNFVTMCRSGINGFPNDGTYQYSEQRDNPNYTTRISTDLQRNTGILFSFERIGKNYKYELPTEGSIREASENLLSFFISHSITPGDTLNLKIAEEKLSPLQQCVFYVMIGEALKLNGYIHKMPSMSVNLSDNYFDETNINKSTLAARLSQSGVNFTLSQA